MTTQTKLPRQAHDLTGERYGKLLVVSFSHSDQGCWWNVKCDCGTEKIAYAASLKRGGTTSCGCSRIDRAKAFAAKTDHASLWHRIAYSYKNGAKQRGIEFSLSEEEVHELVTKDCFYCKAPPSNVMYGGRNKNYYVLHNGIDRSDNDLGYITGNVVPCCRRCNYAKRDMSVEEFLTWAHRLARHTQEPEFRIEDMDWKDLSRHPVLSLVCELYEDVPGG